MGLRDTFLSGLETIFSVLNDAVKTGTYTIETDDGFSDVNTITADSVRCIFENFAEKDVHDLSFYELVQPKDIKGLMPFVDLVNCDITTQAYIVFGTDKYMVEAHDLDPMDVVFTLLLRKV